ncbi:MAG: histidine kinase [Bacteroidia bacterium]|nr:histidine kinase [Bacteroidia bacterium]
MNRLLWLVGAGLFLGIWHFLTGWQPSLTDGHVWKLTDKCVWILENPLPYYTESALHKGDVLLRIDYKPVCELKQIPPQEAAYRLYLYEVQRGSSIHLVFVESLPPFPLGWAKHDLEYLWTEWLLLGVLVGGVLILLFTGEGEGWRERWIARMGLLGGLTALGGLWLFWAQRLPNNSPLYAQIALSAWMWWSAFRLMSFWRYALLLLPAVVLPHFTEGAVSCVSAEAILGLLSLTLPRSFAAAHTAAWIGWVVIRSPLFLPIMAGIGIASHLPEMYRSWRVLPPDTIALRLLALGMSLGSSVWHNSPSDKLLWGVGTLAIGLFAVELIRQFVRSRQRRVRLLQERLPRLWERVEKKDLMDFAEETLRSYAGIQQMQVFQDPNPTIRPWLRRMGDAPPFSTESLLSMPDVALPLPAYGWLLLWEGEYRMRIDDMHRLVPFAAGLSIALRHAELFEAAREAHLSALRGQLSPHFLFNALNTLQSLIGEDPVLAETLMSRLGALLRRTLVHAKQVTVPLVEELTLVQDYLAVEQQRFGKRLVVLWEIPEPCPAVEVPPFCIQLLAENVIKHAVSRLTRPVHLTIRITETPQRIQIEVIDDGPGIDPAQVDKSVGLSNLTTRLQHLYGGAARLTAERLAPGTRISIDLPRPSLPMGVRTHNQAANPSEHEK